MRITLFPLLVLTCLLLSFVSCQSDDDQSPPDSDLTEDPGDTTTALTPNLPDQPYNYANPDLPNFFFAPPIIGQINTPDNNPVSDYGATLGRVLFYDVNLSANNTVSCASCHAQEDGFSDPKAFSEGFDGGLTGRHAMGLSQAAYYARGGFFWDERAATLEDQVLMPIQDAVEMGVSLADLIPKLEGLAYYPDLFEDAFGDPAINADRISLALAQFVRSMVSYQSKFDEGFAQLPPGTNIGDTPFSNFTNSENLGKSLFFSAQTACASCHGTSNFVAVAPENNGLDAQTTDEGFGAVTGNPNDDGKFKVNSLRNIAVSAPFMHDGRFTTLRQVIEHYDNGVQPHPNLAPQLRVPGPPNMVIPRQMNLSENEKQALEDFLNTLTDVSFLTDEKFSDPFEN